MPDLEPPVLTYRTANLSDAAWLAEWNRMLIQDEGHRNQMTVPQLEMRMRNWLSGKYQATIFEHQKQVVGYALFRLRPSSVYLRQFFVHSHHRGRGLGREAIRVLLREVWPRNLAVVVEALMHNNTAREFWKSIGFKEYSVVLEMLPLERPV
jgi:GNAT superfamily N-acetyltransferase